MTSKWGPYFTAQIERLKSGDTGEEPFVRNVMARLVKACPLPLLIMLAEQTVKYNADEWKEYTDKTAGQN